MTLNAKIGFMDFFWRLRHKIIHKAAPQYYIICTSVRMTVIMVFYFIPNSRTDFRCTISLYCERNNLLFGTFLIFDETACISLSYSLICDILFDAAVTSGIGLQRPV